MIARYAINRPQLNVRSFNVKYISSSDGNNGLKLELKNGLLSDLKADKTLMESVRRIKNSYSWSAATTTWNTVDSVVKTVDNVVAAKLSDCIIHTLQYVSYPWKYVYRSNSTNVVESKYREKYIDQRVRNYDPALYIRVKSALYIPDDTVIDHETKSLVWVQQNKSQKMIRRLRLAIGSYASLEAIAKVFPFLGLKTIQSTRRVYRKHTAFKLADAMKLIENYYIPKYLQLWQNGGINQSIIISPEAASVLLRLGIPASEQTRNDEYYEEIFAFSRRYVFDITNVQYEGIAPCVENDQLSKIVFKCNIVTNIVPSKDKFSTYKEFELKEGNNIMVSHVEFGIGIENDGTFKLIETEILNIL